MRAWTPDQSALIAHHEQVIGELAEVAKVARDALAEAEIENTRLQAALNHAGAVGINALAQVRELESTAEWMRAELRKLLVKEWPYPATRVVLERIAAGPPAEDGGT